MPLEGDPLQGEGESGLWRKGEEKEEEALTEEERKRRILFCAVCLTVFLRQVSKTLCSLKKEVCNSFRIAQHPQESRKLTIHPILFSEATKLPTLKAQNPPYFPFPSLTHFLYLFFGGEHQRHLALTLLLLQCTYYYYSGGTTEGQRLARRESEGGGEEKGTFPQPPIFKSLREGKQEAARVL